MSKKMALEKAYNEALKVGEELLEEKRQIEDFKKRTDKFNESRQRPELQELWPMDKSFKVLNQRRIDVDKWETDHKLRVAKFKKMSSQIEEQMEEMEEEEQEEEEVRVRHEEFERKLAMLAHEMAEMQDPDYGATEYCANCGRVRNFVVNAAGKKTCNKCGFMPELVGKDGQ